MPHPHTDQHSGFLTVFWDVGLNLTTCQLLVLRNRDLLLQHGFTSEWEGGIRVSSVSSAAGATAIEWLWLFETGRNSSVATSIMLHPKTETLLWQRHIRTLKVYSDHIHGLPIVDIAGLPGLTQILSCYHTGFFILRNRKLGSYLDHSEG